MPGTVVACYSELTLFFTSSYWIAKMTGMNDFFLVPIKVGMVASTLALASASYRCMQSEIRELKALRGAFILLLDVRAVINDQSKLPVASWLVQARVARTAVAIERVAV